MLDDITRIIAAVGAVAAAWLSNRARKQALAGSAKADDVKEKVENGLAQAAGQRDIKRKIENGENGEANH